MKLKVPQVLAQRIHNGLLCFSAITRTSPIPSDVRLFNYVLAMYINQTPDVVDATLCNNNGFERDRNLIWSKTTVLGLTQKVLSYRWSDAVTDAASPRQRVYWTRDIASCEIDFNPATTGEEMHFVLCIGYDDADSTSRSVDRNITSFDPYGGFARASSNSVLRQKARYGYRNGTDYRHNESMRLDRILTGTILWQ